MLYYFIDLTLLIVSLHVLFQITCFITREVTAATLEWLLPSVGVGMSLQINSLSA